MLVHDNADLTVDGFYAADGGRGAHTTSTHTAVSISTAIAAGTAERIITTGGLGSPGTTSIEFESSQSYPLVTLVSMVAPSPDWFVGVAGLALFENGRWTDERRIELVPWDAGTDSGITFTSPDVVTTPRQPIAPIVTAPLSPGGLADRSGRTDPASTWPPAAARVNS